MSRWTAEEYDAYLKKRATPTAPAAKASKYRNQRVVIGSDSYDSKREAAYHQELKIRELAGEVKEIRRQVSFELCTIVTDLGRRPKQPVEVKPVAAYHADFVFLEHGELVVADCKGMKRNTTEFQTKKRWMAAQYQIKIREVR